MIKRWIKKYFKLIDEADLENAFLVIGNAKDREDMQWKLKVRLFR